MRRMCRRAWLALQAGMHSERVIGCSAITQETSAQDAEMTIPSISIQYHLIPAENTQSATPSLSSTKYQILQPLLPPPPPLSTSTPAPRFQVRLHPPSLPDPTAAPYAIPPAGPHTTIHLKRRRSHVLTMGQDRSRSVPPGW